ncbi:uncharacterized protein PV07_05923 [Cladophialophora immunda]|uniref:Uncharacterized protein n=1 Tax=Cladophialophora immunda TaxID=569365 RepID=A0A0D2AXX4_9EURO|nr:uncharacterized protein PV07_05923 [Cladophialophora immunda]KIW30157.1 hypothetical protein PV07_05923 [Cladophialophora immunda]OQU95896.1 hypothetical protein CLAIMM_02056 [Cladophialophora immunda]
MLVKSTAVTLLVAVGSASAAVMSYGKESVMREDPDFGLCLPTMKFEGGLGGRSSVDFTFLPTDTLCARGQQETTNPNIITNRICDQLATVCGANEAAKALCRESQAKIRALGTRDRSTAETWNTLMGFGGALTNPDGGAPAPNAVKDDLKKRDTKDVEKRAPMIYCSATEWIDDCTGWPAPEPVVKRSEDAAPAAPVVKKRSVEPAAEPAMKKRSEEKAKRADIPMIYCSTTEWIDDCTGWP